MKKALRIPNLTLWKSVFATGKSLLDFEDFFPVLIIKCGEQPLGRFTLFCWSLHINQVKCHFGNHVVVESGMIFLFQGGIFFENHIQTPVEVVFYCPVASDWLTDWLSVRPVSATWYNRVFRRSLYRFVCWSVVKSPVLCPLTQLENRIRQHFVIQLVMLIVFTIGSQLLTSSHRVCL